MVWFPFISFEDGHPDEWTDGRTDACISRAFVTLRALLLSGLEWPTSQVCSHCWFHDDSDGCWVANTFDVPDDNDEAFLHHL